MQTPVVAIAAKRRSTPSLTVSSAVDPRTRDPVATSAIRTAALVSAVSARRRTRAIEFPRLTHVLPPRDAAELRPGRRGGPRGRGALAARRSRDRGSCGRALPELTLKAESDARGGGTFLVPEAHRSRRSRLRSSDPNDERSATSDSISSRGEPMGTPDPDEAPVTRHDAVALFARWPASNARIVYPFLARRRSDAL